MYFKTTIKLYKETLKKPSENLNLHSLSFKFEPKFVVLSERDADETLRKLKSGENKDPLELVYLMFYNSKEGKTISELLDSSIKLVPKIFEDRRSIDKLNSLLLLNASKIISHEELTKIMEVNMTTLEGTVLYDVLVGIGRKKGEKEGEKKGKSMGIDMVFSLLEQGYSLEEAKDILNQEIGIGT